MAIVSNSTTVAGYNFLAEANKTLVKLQTGIEIVLEDRYEAQEPTYVAKLKKNIYVEDGIINFTDEYYLWIDFLGKKYFNCSPHFNNTGSSFWFIK